MRVAFLRRVSSDGRVWGETIKGSSGTWSRSSPPRLGQEVIFQDLFRLLRYAVAHRADEKTARSFRQHPGLILNYFRAGRLISTGMVEGLNNKA